LLTEILKTKSLRFAILLSSVALILLQNGCRIVVPSATEQQKLIAEGAFPGGVPPWVSRAVTGGSGVKRSSSFIPESFEVPSAVAVNNAADHGKITEDLKSTSQTNREPSAEESTKDDNRVSPLDRINSLCPGIESQVTRAITTVEASERTRQLSSLVNRCPQSVDLWLWLAKAYADQNKIAEAKQALERSYGLDPQSQEIERALKSFK
jgi:hypothetical protein